MTLRLAANLAHVLTLLWGQIWRPLLLLCFLAAAATLGSSAFSPEDQKRLQLNDTASISVYEQILRAGSLGSLDVLLVGDSSCLMGIDPELLSQRLGQRVASLCSIGYLGPAGYARLLKRFLASGARYKRLVVVMHPESLIRDKSWDAWTDFVDSGGPPTPSDWNLKVRSGLRLIESKLLSPFIRLPMEGVFGQYYGSVETLRRSVAR